MVTSSGFLWQFRFWSLPVLFKLLLRRHDFRFQSSRRRKTDPICHVFLRPQKAVCFGNSSPWKQTRPRYLLFSSKIVSWKFSHRVFRFLWPRNCSSRVSVGRRCKSTCCYFKRALSINALCACVYIYIRQLSSFRAPMLWFIDLTVVTCHIQYTFLSLCQYVSRENGQNTKILGPPFSYDTKMSADVY